MHLTYNVKYCITLSVKTQTVTLTVTLHSGPGVPILGRSRYENIGTVKNTVSRVNFPVEHDPVVRIGLSSY